MNDLEVIDEEEWGPLDVDKLVAEYIPFTTSPKTRVHRFRPIPPAVWICLCLCLNSQGRKILFTSEMYVK